MNEKIVTVGLTLCKSHILVDTHKGFIKFWFGSYGGVYKIKKTADI